MKSTALIFICLSLTLLGCNKNKACNDKGLPCITMEGKNTFGCLIDGVPFVADVKYTLTGPVAVSGSFDETSKLLKIVGVREDDNDNLDEIYFRCYLSIIPGQNVMDVSTTELTGYIDYSGGNCKYYHDINNKGVVKITFLDMDKNIVSGMFQMDLINSACATDTLIKITEGRFDFGY